MKNLVDILTRSLETLLAIARPYQLPISIAWLAATFVVMLLLVWGADITGKKG